VSGAQGRGFDQRQGESDKTEGEIHVRCQSILIVEQRRFVLASLLKLGLVPKSEEERGRKIQEGEADKKRSKQNAPRARPSDDGEHLSDQGYGTLSDNPSL
jgi:hypothetical protein